MSVVFKFRARPTAMFLESDIADLRLLVLFEFQVTVFVVIGGGPWRSRNPILLFAFPVQLDDEPRR